MRDAGPVMRSLAEPDGLWDRWHTVITEYARAQRTLAGHVDALRASGVRETSPATLPRLARDLLDELSARPVEDGGLDEQQAGRLAALLPAYGEWCAELAASGIPVSINHDDLHSGNICWNGDGPRIIDWGDAVLGHPFGTLLVTLNSLAWSAGIEIDDPRVVAVRDAYLDEFADVGSHEDRVRWTQLARRTGCVSRRCPTCRRSWASPPRPRPARTGPSVPGSSSSWRRPTRPDREPADLAGGGHRPAA